MKSKNNSGLSFGCIDTSNGLVSTVSTAYERGFKKIMNKRDFFFWLEHQAHPIISKPYNWYLNIKIFIFPNYKINWWDKIKRFFFPQQRWIKDYIEYRNFQDKVELIPSFLFGCIIHFVEEEKAFEFIVWSNPEEKVVAKKEIMDCYHYARTGRASIEKEIEDAYDAVEINRKPIQTYHEIYGRVNELEAKLVEEDTKHMKLIIKNYQYLWT